MIKGKKIFGLAVLFAAAFSAQALAQTPEQGCVVLKSVAETEKVEINAKGEKTTKLVPAATAVPGSEVIWTVTANNICKLALEKVSFNQAVPEHMTFVANSAIGPGLDIEYSLNGKTFAAADQLTVVENGVTRKARPEEIRHLRWNFKTSFAPGAQAMGRFRATLN